MKKLIATQLFQGGAKMRWVLLLLPWVLIASTSQAAETHNRLATNRLATNRFATNRLATNRLSADPSAEELLSTEDGRDVYSYIISCALPADVTIVATVDGIPYDFPGSIGLTPAGSTIRSTRKGRAGSARACSHA